MRSRKSSGFASSVSLPLPKPPRAHDTPKYLAVHLQDMAADLEKGAVPADLAKDVGANEQPPAQAEVSPPESTIKKSPFKFSDYMGEEVSANHADILILICCLCSGFTDSTVFNGMVQTD